MLFASPLQPPFSGHISPGFSQDSATKRSRRQIAGIRPPLYHIARHRLCGVAPDGHNQDAQQRKKEARDEDTPGGPRRRAFALTGAARAADWGEGGRVRIATEGAYPPWNDKDGSGRLVGFEIDLAADLCKRMKVECEMTERPWKGTIAALVAGDFDAVMTGMSITGKRKKRIAFSRAYAATPAAFAVRADGPLSGFATKVDAITMDSLDPTRKAAIAALKKAFAGRTIGAQVGTTHEHFLKTHMAGQTRMRTFDVQETSTPPSWRAVWTPPWPGCPT